MKERPILFSAPMVRAILDGSKTQTRRIIKPQPHAGVRRSPFVGSGIEDGHGRELRSAYGQTGDRLWVRETFCPVDDRENGGELWCDYRATPRYEASHPAGWENEPDDPMALKWKPSIHMPRWVSRINLEITGVRVERLQDINGADAKAEGIQPDEVRQMWLFGASADERAEIGRAHV